MTDPEAIRERAWVEHHGRGPGESGPLWIAEDPVTECAGAGAVEAEAMGNLVAVVAEYEAGESEDPMLKTPGPVAPRNGVLTASSSSLLDRVLSVF